ncbi:EF-hand calcium-binding domain-containing protein 4B-like isoform X2 [Liolophura sinensis]|uniref:EF-hand calcium-binding domain-containing protein 4B-like isoform X2 n=1 Tax=Liolophura sinensis TaxID=3198878 RepID=UPI0031593386
MAMYEVQYGDAEPTAEDIQDMMVQKAHELFSVCDTEKKGFITKRDMQRLQQELPLQPEQLEAVFDALDDDKNGYLTLEEFTEGFGSFLGLSTSEVATSMESGGSAERIYEGDDVDDVEEELHFKEMMSNTGAKDLFDDENTIKGMWARLRKDEPELMSNFEIFLSRVSREIKQSQADFSTLESALRSKSTAHDEEVQKLYEEMESQIKQEKEKILLEEKAKEKQLRDEMERELREKDQQLQELLRGHQVMERQMSDLNVVEVETKQENDRLLREKEELEEKLMVSQRNLEESRMYINQLRQQQREEKRERAKAAINMTEGIAMERESLVKQLDVLRDMNKKLRDDKDIAEASQVPQTLDWELHQAMEPAPDLGDLPNDAASEKSSHSGATTPGRGLSKGSRKKELIKQGSVLSNYFNSGSARQSLDSKHSPFEEEVDGADEEVRALMDRSDPILTGSRDYDFDDDEDFDIECDDDLIQENLSGQGSFHSSFLPSNDGNLSLQNVEALEVDPPESGILSRLNGEKRRQSRGNRGRTGQVNGEDMTSSENEGPDNSKARAERRLRRLRKRTLATQGKENDISLTPEHKRITQEDHIEAGIPLSPRVQPVGANASTDRSASPALKGVQDLESSTPERVFKVVFVGDSGVGKSSFIHRFCNNNFKATFSATIGVDFQVRNLVVEGQVVALQLWDTAGQERFRGITKQYFRKADGVLIMYDVTSETSFMSVRNWMQSVHDGAEDGTVLVIVGNKTDLLEDDTHCVVKKKDGLKLADEYGAFFYETSAKSGDNVKETLEAMAGMLKDKEDREIENALKLEDAPKKKGCCS